MSNPSKTEIKKAFDEFVSDDSYFKDYNNYEFFHPEILLRLFVYSPPIEKLKSNIIGLEAGSSLSQQRQTLFTPIAKVIRVSPECTGSYKNLKPGDLVTVTDDIADMQENPRWREFEELKKERPAPELPNVPRFVPKLTQWKNRLFVKDKLYGTMSVDAGDGVTFLLPQTYIISKYDHKNI